MLKKTNKRNDSAPDSFLSQPASWQNGGQLEVSRKELFLYEKYKGVCLAFASDSDPVSTPRRHPLSSVHFCSVSQRARVSICRPQKSCYGECSSLCFSPSFVVQSTDRLASYRETLHLSYDRPKPLDWGLITSPMSACH